MSNVALPQKIDAQYLAQFCPHSGPMVLLKEVIRWNNESITCTADSHKNWEHPLRINGVLSSTQTVEYAAQAASFHACILSITESKPLEGMERFGAISQAFLAIVRNFEFFEHDLDQFKDGILEFNAHTMMTGPRMLQYQVESRVDHTVISQGLISLVIER